MKTLGNTIGDRINQFDSFELQTVETFNQLFVECPITGQCPLAQVIILGPNSNNTRDIVVGDTVIKHKMYSDILYTLDRQDYYLDERDLELTEINGVPV